MNILTNAIEQVIEENNLPYEWSKEIAIELKELQSEKETIYRKDLRSHPFVTIDGKDGDILIVSRDTKNSTSNTFERVVGTTEKQSLTFQAVLKTENLKMMQGSYDVKVTAGGIVYFKSADADKISSGLQYWVATENNSKYE